MMPNQIAAATLIATLLAGGCDTTQSTQKEMDKPADTASARAVSTPRDADFDRPAPATASRSQTQFTSDPAPASATPGSAASDVGTAASPKRFNGSVSLWGEVPGQSDKAPSDASDNLRQVSFTREGADFDLDVDPAGRFLVYASTRHRPTADIYLKGVDGNTVTQVTNDPGNDVMPAISPDGESIAFASDRGGNWDIYIQNIAGGQPIQITNSPAQELHPSWSPDGRTLIFSSMGHKAEGQWEIVVVDVANPAKRRFIGFGLFPKFSPDGSKIVFQRARFRGTRTFSVWTIDFDAVSGEGRRPTEIAAATNAAVINPTWSPDGQRLAFATVVHEANETGAKPTRADLWAINLDGTGRVKLTNDDYANLQPVWAKDGTIYFISDRSGWENVWSLRPTKNVQVAGAKRDESVQSAEVPTTP